MAVRRIRAWPWVALAEALIAIGVFVLAGSAGTIVLAAGSATLFGAIVR
jgi:hypothetical protein